MAEVWMGMCVKIHNLKPSFKNHFVFFFCLLNKSISNHSPLREKSLIWSKHCLQIHKLNTYRKQLTLNRASSIIYVVKQSKIQHKVHASVVCLCKCIKKNRERETNGKMVKLWKLEKFPCFSCYIIHTHTHCNA